MHEYMKKENYFVYLVTFYKRLTAEINVGRLVLKEKSQKITNKLLLLVHTLALMLVWVFCHILISKNCGKSGGGN